MMPETPTTAGCAYLCLVLASWFLPFTIQVVLVRFLGLYREQALRQKGPVAAALIGLLPLGAAFLVWRAAFSIGGSGAIFWPGFYLVTVYLLMGYVYFHVFNMSETARRIRILAHSHRAGAVVKEEMIQSYTAEGMVDLRVKRLSALGEIVLRDGRYRPGRMRLLPAAQLVFFLRRIIFPAGG